MHSRYDDFILALNMASYHALREEDTEHVRKEVDIAAEIAAELGWSNQQVSRNYQLAGDQLVSLESVLAAVRDARFRLEKLGSDEDG